MLYTILLANVAIYGLMVFRTGQVDWGARTLLAWGGDLGELSLHGEPWRLLTGMFLHASPQHVIGNMILLAIAGGFLQAKVGPWRFLAVYLACGLAASLLSAWGHPDIVGVGASGAIAGVVGVIVAFYFGGRSEVRGAWVAQTVGINALYSLAPSVDWLAHLGGFVAGLACGAALLPWAAIREEAR